MTQLRVMILVRACLAATLLARMALAQVEIEVATIKPADPEATAIGNRFTAQVFSYSNVDLKTLLTQVYRVQSYQILDGPGWMEKDRWNIEAKTVERTTATQKMDALKPLLAERFELKVHHETRQLPIYWLVVSKKGLHMAESNPSDGKREGWSHRGNIIRAVKYHAARLYSLLSSELGVPVEDHTGITGRYDFELTWSPDATADSAVPDIFTAIQEQLGLKLEARRGPLEVLVIDHVAKPRAN